MYTGRYFAKRYFAGRYFPPIVSGEPPPPTGEGTQYGYFVHKHFSKRYFNNGYFPGASVGGEIIPPITDDTGNGGRTRSHRRDIFHDASKNLRLEERRRKRNNALLVILD